MTSGPPGKKPHDVSLKTPKGPAIFLAHFARDEAPFDSLSNIGRGAASLGYRGVYLHSWDRRLCDVVMPHTRRY